MKAWHASEISTPRAAAEAEQLAHEQPVLTRRRRLDDVPDLEQLSSGPARSPEGCAARARGTAALAGRSALAMSLGKWRVTRRGGRSGAWKSHSGTRSRNFALWSRDRAGELAACELSAVGSRPAGRRKTREPRKRELSADRTSMMPRSCRRPSSDAPEDPPWRPPRRFRRAHRRSRFQAVARPGSHRSHEFSVVDDSGRHRIDADASAGPSLARPTVRFRWPLLTQHSDVFAASPEGLRGTKY